MTNWHPHSDDRLDVGRRVFRSAVKEKVMANVEKPLTRLHTDMVAEVYDQLELTESEKTNLIRSHPTFRTTVNSIKSVRRPKLPRAIDDVSIPMS